MLSFLTSEAGMSLIGLVMGFFFRQKAEREKAINARVTGRDDSMDRAAARSSGGTWMRRALFGLVAFVFVAVILAPFLNEPVIVENSVQKGILFWKRTVTEFVTVEGVLFPAEIRRAFLCFIAFYLGQGVK
jgi:Na+/H+ antiporter NhaD/arsenite permease-like protein